MIYVQNRHRTDRRSLLSLLAATSFLAAFLHGDSAHLHRARKHPKPFFVMLWRKTGEWVVGRNIRIWTKRGWGYNFHANLPCGADVTLTILMFSSFVVLVQLYIPVYLRWDKSRDIIYLNEFVVKGTCEACWKDSTFLNIVRKGSLFQDRQTCNRQFIVCTE